MTVTFIVANKLLDGVKAEAARDFAADEADAAARLRCLSRSVHHVERFANLRLRFLPIEQGVDPMNTAEYLQNFLATWNSLLEGVSATTQSLDGTLHCLDFRSTPPTALILDVRKIHYISDRSSLPPA